MKLGVRAKLFAFSLFLILVVGLLAGSFLEHQRRTSIENRVESELLTVARMAREMITDLDVRSVETIDSLSDRLGAASDSRITVVDSNGWVIGDSELSIDEIPEVENHGKRPEILAAFQSGLGVNRRHSATVDSDLLYVALPYGIPSPAGVVRASVLLADVDKAITELRWSLFIAGVLGLLGATLLSGLAAHIMTRTLRSLINHAKKVSEYSMGAFVVGRDEIQSLAGSFNRLSEELQAQVEIMAWERDRSKAILDCMSEALFALDEQKRIMQVNPAAMDLFSLDQPPLGQLLPEVSGESQLGILVEGASPGRVVSTEFCMEGSGRRCVLARVASPRSGSGCVVVMHDITEIRMMEQFQREFVANASHELRTPVSVIRANTETLLDGAIHDSAMSLKLLNALDRNAQRLVHLVSDLLDLARLDAKQREIKQESLSVEEVVMHIVDILQPLANKKGQAIDLALHEGTRVRGDLQALEQTLLNLLDNAIKYAPDNGKIRISSRLAGSRVQIRVYDNGPGIPEQHRPFLFQRFYRIDPGRSRDVGGTGLGLSIVKNLVEAMGGVVGMEPALPTGSIFWFALPKYRG
ncbi:MAG: PAS domain-containing protein [Gammaproteobacteria bacterium]|nr:PAS domain-containing protein [Gammaproteobacteria bacterium]